MYATKKRDKEMPKKHIYMDRRTIKQKNLGQKRVLSIRKRTCNGYCPLIRTFRHVLCISLSSYYQLSPLNAFRNALTNLQERFINLKIEF